VWYLPDPGNKVIFFVCAQELNNKGTGANKLYIQKFAAKNIPCIDKSFNNVALGSWTSLRLIMKVHLFLLKRVNP
jgi:hypothetical protein